jgi:hypothetical protein
MSFLARLFLAVLSAAAAVAHTVVGGGHGGFSPEQTEERSIL